MKPVFYSKTSVVLCWSMHDSELDVTRNFEYGFPYSKIDEEMR